MKSIACESTLPDDSRWSCRASCVRVGSVGVIAKKAKVWLWFCNEWHVATVRRRLPGGVYLCDLDAVVSGCKTAVLSANCFGGVL